MPALKVKTRYLRYLNVHIHRTAGAIKSLGSFVSYPSTNQGMYTGTCIHRYFVLGDYLNGIQCRYIQPHSSLSPDPTLGLADYAAANVDGAASASETGLIQVSISSAITARRETYHWRGTRPTFCLLVRHLSCQPEASEEGYSKTDDLHVGGESETYAVRGPMNTEQRREGRGPRV